MDNLNNKSIHDQNVSSQNLPEVKTSKKSDSLPGHTITKSEGQENKTINTIKEKEVFKNMGEEHPISSEHVGNVKITPNKQKNYEEKADKALNHLMDTQGLVEKDNGRLCWSNGVWTGQTTSNLKKELTAQFKTATQETKIGVRLKFGENDKQVGFKHGGKTFIANLNIKGEVENVSQKVKNLGAGTYGKVQKLQTLDSDKTSAIKFASPKGLVEGLKEQKEQLENILNFMGVKTKSLPTSIEGLKLGLKNLENAITPKDISDGKAVLEKLISKYTGQEVKIQESLEGIKNGLEAFNEIGGELDPGSATEQWENDSNTFPKTIVALNLALDVETAVESLSNRLEIGQKDVNNELIQLMRLNPDSSAPGVQRAPSHLYVVLRGSDENLQGLGTKMGHSSSVYSGTAEEITWQNGWNSEEKNKALSDLCSGLAHCHNNNVYLGDIKGANIFRDDKTKALHLADFGGSTFIEGNEEIEELRTSRFTITSGFTHMNDLISMQSATDVEEYKEMRGKMDVFSLGASIFQLLTGEMPYEQNDNGFPDLGDLEPSMITDALKNSWKPESSTQEMGQLIFDMLNPNLEERPSSEVVYERMANIIK